MIVHVVTHPEVQLDPAVPVPRWGLSAAGRDRLRRLVAVPWARRAVLVASSAELKALQTARAVADVAGAEVLVDEGLGENDRSATGFVPPQEFEALADAFFAEPARSVRGWERAVDAQARVVAAVERVLVHARSLPGVDDDAVVVVATHGGVGTLLQCALRGVGIDRCHDQPGQGSWFGFDSRTGVLTHGWRRF